MTEYDFTLSDRITKIKSINELYDLEHNAYISFSGGKDSTVLHYLIDKALPNNNIPRLFLNTGIEYKAVLDFVKSMAQNDSRIIIYNSGVNIKQMLNDKGYPFKSKEHANKVSMYKNNSKSEAVKKYIDNVGTRYGVPKILEYQFKEQLDFKISDRCCFELKKNIAHKWAVENNKTITLTGMRSSEGGQRSGITCAIFNKGKLKKFHPLAPVDDNFMAQFLQRELHYVLFTIHLTILIELVVQVVHLQQIYKKS